MMAAATSLGQAVYPLRLELCPAPSVTLVVALQTPSFLLGSATVRDEGIAVFSSTKMWWDRIFYIFANF